MSRDLSSITPLDAERHSTARFACRDDDIDAFLKDSAAAEQALGLNQVYVTSDHDSHVLAYFTLSPVTVRVEPALLTKLGLQAAPYPSIGGYLLGRLGVNRSLQGNGVGAALLVRAAQIAAQEACLSEKRP